jgi:phenylalanine ammonia-lyase
VGLDERVVEIVRRHTEKIYGVLREGETVTGRFIVPYVSTYRESTDEDHSGRHTSWGGTPSQGTQVHTAVMEHIQRALIRDSHFGILSGETDFSNAHALRMYSSAIPLSDPVESTSFPESWVRATMIIRANTLAYETSGVRPVLLEKITQLLNMDVIPRLPLRASISGAGDLSPLAYIGGVLQGKPAVQAWIGDRIQGGRKLVPGDEALSYAEIEPLEIRAKEGMAIFAGTAPSAAVASLALHEAMCLAALSQVLTAMSAEALCAAEESFHPLISELKPHPGQIECANNIRSFIQGSKLTATDAHSKDFLARSDRYGCRTAPQWIGPVLEDLQLAHSQVSIEINSATDSPIIDYSGKMIHGGNFQAKSLSSAMEKVRQACQSLGQIHFAQCTEIINPASNKGLPANLVIDEPSMSGLFKGTDILIAALQSELGFLANPVSTHVQFAETGYQAINSLALISGRYTLTAVDVLTQLAAAHLVALCQALDLRALHIQFLYALAPKFKVLTRRCLSECIEQITPSSDGGGAEIAYDLWVHLSEQLNRTMHLDSRARFESAMDYLQTRLLRELPTTQQSLEAVQQWNDDCVNEASATYQTVRARYLANPDATPILGKASRRMYTYVRRTLEVPLFGSEYLGKAEWDDGTSQFNNRYKYRSMGAMITAVYEAMRNGALYSAVVDCFEEV